MFMRITTTQFAVQDSALANAEIIEDIIQQSDTDWILTPEGALSGYFQPPVINRITEQNWLDTLEVEPHLQNVIATKDVGVLLGTGWMEPDGAPYNQVRIYQGSRGYQGAYAKRLLTTTHQGGGERNAYIPGWSPCVFNLSDTVRGGVLICNDIWATPMASPQGNPYYINELAQAGVNVLFCSVNCNVKNWCPIIYDWHQSHLQMYAKFYNMYVVVSGNILSMDTKPVTQSQCPIGVIGPDGEWIHKFETQQQETYTVEIK